MKDYLFRGKLSELDPAVYEVDRVGGRAPVSQTDLDPQRKPGSAGSSRGAGFSFPEYLCRGIPARGNTLVDAKAEIVDYPARLVHFRRYADRRYYKGVEYADSDEELARRRCAELFATETISADDIYVNVQPLSGAPANNAVYHALVQPGETIMGMDLLHGGHLTAWLTGQPLG